jgi:replication factor C subunit 3/5
MSIDKISIEKKPKNTHCPWVEKHRPKLFDEIVLDSFNKKILKNIIDTSYFPNLLFYGPPGTGKTTTIINLINSYQEKLQEFKPEEEKNKCHVIHLNASDERGIDIIRNQISCFVNSKPLFNSITKFVILDEVDYMTKNAQQALRYLLQNNYKNVRFCLICNYISRIDEGLQNEFIKLRFNQLPEKDIIHFLKNVSDNEKINITNEKLLAIQKLYKSDMRSMINFIQSNQLDSKIYIINNDIWEELFTKISRGDKLEDLFNYTQNISYNYNIDHKNIIKDFLNYIIRNKPINSSFINFIENIIHFQDCKNSLYLKYVFVKLLVLCKKIVL